MKATSNFMPPTTIVIHYSPNIFSEILFLQVIFVYQLFADVFIWFEYSRNFTVLENIGTI